MGRAVVEAAQPMSSCTIVAGIERAGSPLIGQSIESLGLAVNGPIVGSLQDAPDARVVIDFSTPESTVSVAKSARDRGLALVSGTTGLSQAHLEELRTLGQTIPILHSPNMSVGVNVLFGLINNATAQLGPEWDVEITEAHHHHKVDAPSGTAKKILQIITESSDPHQTMDIQYGREGHTGPRPAKQIGMHVVRGGDVVGDHTVVYYGEGERLEITHRATDRAIFARGALRAAHWVVGQPPGFYALNDVLG